MKYELKAERVTEIFHDCLFKNGEDTTGYVPAEGVVTNAGFHPVRIKSHGPEIMKMLMELPEQFRESVGGGWSFLNACMDRDGHQWGEHRSMEQLVQLGIGIGKVKYQLPRDMWNILPGGVPYFSIQDGEPLAK